MTSIETVKQDFGSSELNDVYANLDLSTREIIDKIKNDKIKIQLLKDISNPELNDLFNSWHHHSRFSDIRASETLDKINHSISGAHAYLKAADKLVLSKCSAINTLPPVIPMLSFFMCSKPNSLQSFWYSLVVDKSVELSSKNLSVFSIKSESYSNILLIKVSN